MYLRKEFSKQYVLRKFAVMEEFEMFPFGRKLETIYFLTVRRNFTTAKQKKLAILHLGVNSRQCQSISVRSFNVYRNGPEWAELPEWTTAMDLNKCSNCR